MKREDLQRICPFHHCVVGQAWWYTRFFSISTQRRREKRRYENVHSVSQSEILASKGCYLFSHVSLGYLYYVAIVFSLHLLKTSMSSRERALHPKTERYIKTTIHRLRQPRSVNSYSSLVIWRVSFATTARACESSAYLIPSWLSCEASNQIGFPMQTHRCSKT